VSKPLLFSRLPDIRVHGVFHSLWIADIAFAAFAIVHDKELNVYSATYLVKVIPVIQPPQYIGDRLHPATALPFFDTFEEAVAACTAKSATLMMG
jgi:hypothetical protein